MSNDARDRDREKREIALAPGSYAYMQDTTKGIVKTYVGPTVINQTGTETPVVWNPAAGRFDRCATLEDAVRLSPVAAEGSYLILDNPSRDGKHPTDGAPTSTPDLDIGRKIIIPGPCTFALWPGQDAKVVEGHQLRSNEYLLVRVYNEEEARKNWGSAVMKPASGDTPATPVAQVPADLTVGKLFIIRGTEVSFYIPPTGVGVVPEGMDGQGRPVFVRDALTLEKLEYAILVDENGSKRYEKGPQVVFPRPTEVFRKDEKGNVKFRAIELNEIQGLHIKVISSYKDEVTGQEHKEGEELFITGRDTAIYFPREEHSLIKYDGKSKHFATAIPTGEGRYVMDRMTGEILMVRGPAMLLPDPRSKVIVRRALSENQSNLWYPGNAESLEYNRVLRSIQLNAPTTRQGAISEGDFERGVQKKGLARRGGAPVAVAAALMDASMVSGDQQHVGDEFSRASTYSQPRTVTLNTKFEGVPSIDVWTGYAVMVVSKSGKRRVEKGPGTVLLGYDESLEVLELSTGKPKTTDNLLKTVYLRITNNKVSDIVKVETNDHVGIDLSLSFRVGFEGDESKWFEADNYVKLLCDHVRSVLKGAIKKAKVEDFYANAVDFIRDLVLGTHDETGKRPGMLFTENGMRVTDIEVLGVKIQDERIRKMLDDAQHDVVQSNIELNSARRGLQVAQEKEGIARKMAENKAATTVAQQALETQLVASQLDLFMAKVSSTLKQHEENKKATAAQQEIQDLVFDKDLARAKRRADQDADVAQAEQERKLAVLKAEVEAAVARFQAAQGGFSEALLALSHEETVVKVAEALSVQNFIGGKNFAEVVQKVFAGTPLQHLLDRVVSGSNGNGRIIPEAAPDKPVLRQ